MKTRTLCVALGLILLLTPCLQVLPVRSQTEADRHVDELRLGHTNDNTVSASADRDPVFVDDFTSAFTGYNQSLWDLESFASGSVGWVEGEYFNMSAERHSFRTISSKTTFSSGSVVNIRARMEEAESIVCIGWTNSTAADGWNYLFWGDSVLLQAAISTVLLEQTSDTVPGRRTVLLSGVDASEWHDYRLVWNKTVAIAYVDGIRCGVISDGMPAGPLHFKMAITEFRNMTTEGWVAVDRVSISPHSTIADEGLPIVVLESPGNNTLNLPGDVVDLGVIGSNGSLTYSWDGSGNRSVSEPFTIAMPSAVGTHVLNLYCMDGYGFGMWTSAQFRFEIVRTLPTVSVPWITQTPFVDGIIQDAEWPQSAMQALTLSRFDGTRLDVVFFLGYNNDSLYIGIKSPLASGHDSRAVVTLNAVPDGHFHGVDGSPMLSFRCEKGSPKAYWEGYNLVCFINESESGSPRWITPSEGMSGYIAKSVEVGEGVDYEFRIPLSEVQAGPGSSIGMSLSLPPSGIWLHNFEFPIWRGSSNASRMALLYLSPIDTSLIVYTGYALCIAAVAPVVYLVRRRKSVLASTQGNETLVRLKELVESYDEVSIERLSSLLHLSQGETLLMVKKSIRNGGLAAVLDDHGRVVKRNPP